MDALHRNPASGGALLRQVRLRRRPLDGIPGCCSCSMRQRNGCVGHTCSHTREGERRGSPTHASPSVLSHPTGLLAASLSDRLLTLNGVAMASTCATPLPRPRPRPCRLVKDRFDCHPTLSAATAAARDLLPPPLATLTLPPVRPLLLASPLNRNPALAFAIGPAYHARHASTHTSASRSSITPCRPLTLLRAVSASPPSALSPSTSRLPERGERRAAHTQQPHANAACPRLSWCRNDRCVGEP